MPLLASEANKLTHETLQRGIVETVIDRGARELLAQLPFKSYKGETDSFNYESSIGTGNSARDPYGTGNIPSGTGSNVRVDVKSKMLVRNADTAKIDTVVKNNINDLQADDILKQAKKLAQDFRRHFFNGIDPDSGHTGYNVWGLEEWFKRYGSTFTEQEIYHTDDGTADGSKQNLSLNAIDDLLSRNYGQGFDVLYMNRETKVYFKALLNAMGGNTGGMIQMENFGRPMLAYDNIPIVVSDDVGAQRSFSDADIDGGGNAGSGEIVVNDSGFLGFHRKDDGQTITYDGSDYTIDSVTDSHTVSITTNPGGATGNSGHVDAQNVIYAVRYDEIDGVTAVYSENRGVPADAGRWNGPIAGFDATDIGLLEDSNIYRVRLDFFGNVTARSPYSIARLSSFSNGDA